MTTSKDKTGDQLVASIRKSKTGSVAGKTPPAEPATTSRAGRKKIGDDGTYSYGRRVWPD